jgi:hypothetical protein
MTGLRRLVAAGLVAVLLGGAAPALAHELSLARWSQLPTADPATLALELLVPVDQAARGDLVWPDGCEETVRRRVARGALVRLHLEARCDGPPAPDAVVATDWGVDGALFARPGADPRLLAGDDDDRLRLPVGAAPSRDLATVASRYVGLGATHILEGWDHLAFVLCLFLLARGRFLVVLITAFTVGHSASLALAWLGAVRVPVPPTEAVIALSIVFMAREALLHDGGTVRDRRRETAVVVGFGLLHGLGFARALADLGVAAGERLVGLLAFNVGVELGQLLFVGFAAAIWGGLRALAVERGARRIALFGCGVAGAAWFTQRLASFA